MAGRTRRVCRYCSVPTCPCAECEPLKVEGSLTKRAAEGGGLFTSHIEGRCEACNHKYWMMVANF